MTVTVNDRQTGPYTGDGTVKVFAYDFRIDSDAEINVYKISSDGVEAKQTLIDDYTVTGIQNIAGGSIVFITAPLPTEKVFIEGATPQAQEAAYTSNGAFPAASHEDALDNLQRQIQEESSISGRSVKVGRTDTVPTLPPTPTKNKILARNSSGEIIHLEEDTLSGNVTLADGWEDHFQNPPPESLDDLEGVRYKATLVDMLSMDADELTDGCVIALVARSDGDVDGGGLFEWRAGDTTATDDGNIYAHNTESGRFFRISDNRYANVKHFGAKGDGSTDDAVAIQAAIDTGLDVYFPTSSGHYMVGSTLNLTTSGQRLLGDGYAIELAGATIEASHDGAVFNVTSTLVSFYGLSLEGTDVSGGIGVQFLKTSNTDDTDGYIKGCNFKDFDTTVKYVGRGLCFIDNQVVSGVTVLDISWPTSGTEGTGFQAIPEGMRAFRLQNNRIHSCSTFVKTTGSDREYFTGAIIEGNQLDVGRVLFNGGINNSIIANNVIKHSNSTIIYIDAGGVGVNIANNVIEGTSGDVANSPAVGIWFDTGSAPQNVNISNNTIRFMDDIGINIVPNASYMSINGNNISHVGQDGSGSCISVSGQFFQSNISNNTLNPNNVSECIVFSGTVGNSYIMNNGVDNSDTLISGTFTDNGTNIVTHRGRVLIGGCATPISALSAKTASSVLGTITRTGSTGGLGWQWNNDSGGFYLFFSPTGSNAGSITPSGDNGVNLGSSSSRFATIYAGTGTINTSDERSKTNIETIPDEWLEAWADVEWCRFKFKDSVSEKAEGARWHTGLIAQQIESAFSKRGLNAFEIGLLCYDEWDDFLDPESGEAREAGNRYGVRYSEAQAIEAAFNRRKRLKADSGVTLDMVEDIYKRLSVLEKRGGDDTSVSFIESQMSDDETFEDAKVRINDEFDYLNHKGKSSPLEGEEYERYKELTKGLGKS